MPAPSPAAMPVTSRAGLSSFVLKVVAIVGMTANHACYLLYPGALPVEAACVLFTIGGLTFPIMAFLIVEGYRHTSNVRRYALRLFVFALVSQAPYWLILSHNGNVLFTLLLGLITLYLHDRMQNRVAFWAAFLTIVAASSLCDWGVIGIVMIFMMRVLPDRHERVVLPVLLPVLAVGLPALSEFVTTGELFALLNALYAFVGCGLTVPLMLAYNGQRGRPMKYFFYAYYPLHIVALGLVKWALLGSLLL